VAAQALVGLTAIALFVGFVLALRSSEASYGDKGTTAATVGQRTPTPTPVIAQPAAAARRDPPIVYVYGPPELAMALRADLTGAAMAAGLDGDSTPEVIIDGLDVGQRKVFFIDLR
jgi:hypothetical protein